MQYWIFFYSLISQAVIITTTMPLTAETYPLSFPNKDFFTDHKEIKRGDEFFEATLYPQAADVYRGILQTENDHHLLSQTRFRFAQTAFSIGNFQEAMQVLNENLQEISDASISNQNPLRNHSLYLKAIVQKELKDYTAAKNTFLAYISSSSPTSLTFYDEAAFEIGLLEFLQGNYTQAAETFESLKSKEANSRLCNLCGFYLARIAQQQRKFPKAAEILDSLEAKFPKNDPLYFEYNYLLGETFFALNDYHKALKHFQNAIHPSVSTKFPWQDDALYQLGCCHLKIADESLTSIKERDEALKKAEEAFAALFSVSQDEKAALALAQCYLNQAIHWKKAECANKAEKLLSLNLFTSKEAKNQALLLRAEAAPTYLQRDHFYRMLTEGDEPEQYDAFFARGWYMRGINDFEQARIVQQTENQSAAQNYLNQSIHAFQKAFQLLKEHDSHLAGAALKYQAMATGNQDHAEANRLAMEILESLMKDHSFIWDAMQNKDEIYYLHGYFAGRLSQHKDKEENLRIAKRSLEAAAAIPMNTFGDRALNHLASLYYHNKDFAKAEESFLRLATVFPDSPLAAEAWLWSAFCADHLHSNPAIGKERRRHAYEQFPDSPIAAQAFFTYYTYPEYLQGDRSAIKHLHTAIETYQNSVPLIDAHYLIGLDYKRDRKTPEGKWIRKKSLKDAIDAFHKVEVLFDELVKKKAISEDKLDYYTAMRYRAKLEKAIINLKIAEEANGTKKQIFIDYAKEEFKNLSKELKEKDNPFVKRLYKDLDYPLIEQENSFWLAQAYIKAEEDAEALLILSGMIERYKSTLSPKGYFFARTLEEQGKIAMRQNDYQKGLSLLKKAEESAKGNVLSTDQRLELQIQQSQCYRGLNQYDHALLILSKVINDDAISGLRIKAMYLRAEIYEEQQRPELARKQLESIVKKGGFWGKKAQERISYGY